MHTLVQFSPSAGVWFVLTSGRPGAPDYRDDAYPARDVEYELAYPTIPPRIVDSLERDGWPMPAYRIQDDTSGKTGTNHCSLCGRVECFLQCVEGSAVQ